MSKKVKADVAAAMAKARQARAATASAPQTRPVPVPAVVTRSQDDRLDRWLTFLKAMPAHMVRKLDQLGVIAEASRLLRFDEKDLQDVMTPAQAAEVKRLAIKYGFWTA